jgi:hypothetical protein
VQTHIPKGDSPHWACTWERGGLTWETTVRIWRWLVRLRKRLYECWQFNSYGVASLQMTSSGNKTQIWFGARGVWTEIEESIYMQSLHTKRSLSALMLSGTGAYKKQFGEEQPLVTWVWLYTRKYGVATVELYTNRTTTIGATTGPCHGCMVAWE